MGDFCMTFRDVGFKRFLPVVLLFAQTQQVVWGPRAMYRITLGQKTPAALFQRLWTMECMEDGCFSSSRSAVVEWVQGPGRAEGVSPEPAKLPQVSTRGAGVTGIPFHAWGLVVACQVLVFDSSPPHQCLVPR